MLIHTSGASEARLCAHLPLHLPSSSSCAHQTAVCGHRCAHQFAQCHLQRDALLLLCTSLAVPSGFSQIELCKTFPPSFSLLQALTHILSSLSGSPSLFLTYINPDSPFPSLNPLSCSPSRSPSIFLPFSYLIVALFIACFAALWRAEDDF